MVLYQNHQWAVHDWGLQSVKPGAPFEYNIDASRLLERRGAGDGKLYDWPLQLAEKTWIDIELFIEAYSNALKLLADKYTGTPDSNLLQETFAAARKRAHQ